MLTINQRLKSFLIEKGIQQKKAAREMGLNDKQFNNWLNNTKPSIEGLERIGLYFKDLDMRWLLTGEKNAINDLKTAEQSEKHVHDLGELQNLLNEKEKQISLLMEIKESQKSEISNLKEINEGLRKLLTKLPVQKLLTKAKKDEKSVN